MGQGPSFTQFFVAPMTVNPSLIGSNMTSTYRLSILSRNQSWGVNGVQPYRENMINLEKNIFSKNLKTNPIFLAVSMLNESSNQGILNINYFNFTISNKIRISENNFIKAGIQTSFVNHFFNLNNSNFQSEFGNYGFTSNNNQLDPIGLSNNNFIELNPGFVYEHKNKNYSYELGGTVFHISKFYNNSINNSKYLIPIKYIINGSFRMKLKNNDSFLFSGFFQSNNIIKRLNFGGLYSINFSNSSKSFSFGLWNQLNESANPYFEFKNNKLQFGLSFDVIKFYNKYSNLPTSSIETSIVFNFGN